MPPEGSPERKMLEENFSEYHVKLGSQIGSVSQLH
jgi:hypothetical protein